METLGEYLKREREFRQIPLLEVAEATRIGRTSLNAIERDDYDELPGKAFIRGYLKAYAKHVGLDVADVLLRFEQEFEQDEGEDKSEQDRKRWRWQWEWKHVWIAAATIGIIALAALLASR